MVNLQATQGLSRRRSRPAGSTLSSLMIQGRRASARAVQKGPITLFFLDFRMSTESAGHGEKGPSALAANKYIEQSKDRPDRIRTNLFGRNDLSQDSFLQGQHIRTKIPGLEASDTNGTRETSHANSTAVMGTNSRSQRTNTNNASEPVVLQHSPTNQNLFAELGQHSGWQKPAANHFSPSLPADIRKFHDEGVDAWPGSVRNTASIRVPAPNWWMSTADTSGGLRLSQPAESGPRYAVACFSCDDSTIFIQQFTVDLNGNGGQCVSS